MNIFWLDNDMQKCVEYHCDKHVVKMILEHVQLLSASSKLSGVDQGYKISHMNHPATKWLLQSLDNWILLYGLTELLHDEYVYRYGRTHKSYLMLQTLLLPNIESKGITNPPQCMLAQYKCDDIILAYRNYYIGEKARFAVWTGRDIPPWFNYEGKLIEK